MGCDIHWHSETKVDGEWVCDQANTRTVEVYEEGTPHIGLENFPHRGRNYWLFGLLNPECGRSEWPWSFEPKGEPEDSSAEVQEQIREWGADGHSHSYLTRAELKAKLGEIHLARAELLITPGGMQYSEGANHLMQRLHEIISSLNAAVPDEDQRLVFWFDN